MQMEEKARQAAFAALPVEEQVLEVLDALTTADATQRQLMAPREEAEEWVPEVSRVLQVCLPPEPVPGPCARVCVCVTMCDALCCRIQSFLTGWYSLHVIRKSWSAPPITCSLLHGSFAAVAIACIAYLLLSLYQPAKSCRAC
jgi:hypothetical protein